MFAKLGWYLEKCFNLVWACLNLLVYFIFHPKKLRSFLFPIFSSINEFYQVSHGELNDFEQTPLFKQMKQDMIFARSNVFNMEAIVTRPNETQTLATLVYQLKPKTVFEIGTYNGFTTYHFA